jgi:AAA domain (dynein-related subfamily)
MQTLTVPQFVEYLYHVTFRNGCPVFGWGEPGVGKSAGVQQFTTKINGLLVDVRMGQYDSVDLRGFPGVEPGTNQTVWYAPSTLPFKGNPKFADVTRPIVLFLDEMNSANSSVQAVGYQLINDRCVGEHELMDNVVVIAAGNRETDRGVTTRMPTPLANRFTHVEVGVDVEAWSAHAQEIGLPPEGIAFINFRKNLLSTFDPASTAKAFATPRSWVKAMRFYADPQMPDLTKYAALDGTVGPGPAAEFWGFVKVWQNMPSLKEIAKAPTTFPLPDELSMRYAVAVAIGGAMTFTTTKDFHPFLKRLDREQMLLSWSIGMRKRPDISQTPEFMDVAKELKAVFV